jgi:hypothetical protein
LLTSALSVALHNPMPIAPGTSIATNTGNEWVDALPPQPTAANKSPTARVPPLSERGDDWSDHGALHDNAEQAERAQQVTRVRRVEAEPARAKQRERRLVDREGRPVRKIDREKHAQMRALPQLGKRAPRRPAARMRAMHRLGQPEECDCRCDDRNHGGRPDWCGCN